MREWSGSDLVLFVGRFGSGKTETAINYAVRVARSKEQGTRDLPPASCILIDLDIVTPYFRSREMAEAMRNLGVEVLAPSAISRYLDTPAITPQILGAIQQTERPTVMDVGGDRQGARALGQFSAAIRQRGYTMFFVVNPYRPFTNTLAGLAASIAEIEQSARLQVTGLVSNPNLINETTAAQIVQGHGVIEQFAQELGLPIAFICIERRWLAELGTNHFSQPVLALERYFVQPWENGKTEEE